jgi:uncharacterized membrane protein
MGGRGPAASRAHGCSGGRASDRGHLAPTVVKGVRACPHLPLSALHAARSRPRSPDPSRTTRHRRNGVRVAALALEVRHHVSVHFEDWMDLVVKGFEVVGVVILAVGSVVALLGAGMTLARGDRPGAYAAARRNVGRAVLLGLEILIIADIVETITLDATVESALVLGIIVLVRTFLSFSLEIELEGTPPWRRAARAAA